MGEVMLHGKELGLSAILGIVQLNSLSLHVSQLILVRLVPVYISNDCWIFEVDEGIVDEEPAGRRGMENIEVSVLNPTMVEIGRREGPSMKGGGVLAFPFAAYSHKVSVFPNAPVRDVLSSLCLSLLIKEDDGVKVRLSTIIPYPPFAWVVRILEITGKGGGKVNGLRRGRGSGDSGLILCEADGFVTIDTVLAHIWFGEI